MVDDSGATLIPYHVGVPGRDAAGGLCGPDAASRQPDTG
jgi:hypothetical protein